MKTSDFFYNLPEELIAQTPIEPRDQSRMLVCNRGKHQTKACHFSDIVSFLRPNDALVINETRVIPARIFGIKEGSGIVVEFLLLKRLNLTQWETLVRPGRRLPLGTRVQFGDGLLQAVILEKTPDGGRIVEFTFEGAFEALLDKLGEMPLPPYIHERLYDRERYQTVYSKTLGSSAAPTAGLHFTKAVLDAIALKGCDIIPVLLHVGLGTFRPVTAERTEDHQMHEEYYQVSDEAAARINRAREQGGRIVAIGTTSVRTLETLSDDSGHMHAGQGQTGIFITPGYRFKMVDVLLTNFHLPESSLLMLVSAFMGRENALECYQEAINDRYRFFSFGDCMLIGEGLTGEPCNEN